MRQIKAGSSSRKNALPLLLRTFRLSALVLGIGLFVASGVARAEDDDDRSFEDRIIENLMAGLGGTNMDNRGIEYRERSPLVVPPRLDLPPPASAAKAAPNWPKDPDVQRRKAAALARQQSKVSPEESARVLLPSEMAARRPKGSKSNIDSSAPGGGATDSILSPSQLGYHGGLMGIFGSGTKDESTKFTGEPTRDSLTQPPSGYQTPSPNFAYGTGPKQYVAPKIDPSNGKVIE